LGKRPGRELFRPLGKAISDYKLIKDNDEILLGISGGKDGLIMAWLLADIRKRAPVKFSLAALTIDPGEPFGFKEKELQVLEDFLKGLKIPYHVVKTNIAKVVQEYPTKKTACSLCANLRRGAFYKAARQLGFKKVSLAHHLDDAIETLLLNMFYQGSFRCFKPKTYLTRRQVEVIRPLVYIEEWKIAKATKDLELPVIPPKCHIAGTTCRQAMKELVSRLSAEIPGMRKQMRRVLKQLWIQKKTPQEMQCKL